MSSVVCCFAVVLKCARNLNKCWNKYGAKSNQGLYTYCLQLDNCSNSYMYLSRRIQCILWLSSFFSLYVLQEKIQSSCQEDTNRKVLSWNFSELLNLKMKITRNTKSQVISLLSLLEKKIRLVSKYIGIHLFFWSNQEMILKLECRLIWCFVVIFDHFNSRKGTKS